MEGFDRRKFLKGSSVAVGLAGAMTVVPGAIPAFAKSTQSPSATTATATTTRSRHGRHQRDRGRACA